MQGKLDRFVPEKACFCCPINIGVQVLLLLIILLRVTGIVCGGFYGPYFYLVISLGCLYLSADVLVLYSVFWKGDKNEDCEYPNQRIWLGIWQVLNILAVLGLIIAIGWYINLGTWAMLHEPIHFVVFILIMVLAVVLVYTGVVVYALAVSLRELYIDSVLGATTDEEDANLTSGGRRVSI